MRLLALAALALLAAGCAGATSEPYHLYATNLNCDAVTVTGRVALIDPTQTFSVCQSPSGEYFFPNGVLANTDVTTLGGAMSGAIAQSAAIAAFLGGF